MNRRVSGPPPVPPLEIPGRRREESINKTEKKTARSSRRSVLISTAAIYAALYVALTLVFSPFSYGEVQLRVANILIGLIPVLGWPAVIGQTIGVFLANVGSPLGPIDLLNTVPTLLFSWLLWKLRRVSVFLGLTIYSIGLGISVSLTLVYAFGLPLLATLLTTTAGIFAATAVLGYILYRAVERSGALRRFLEER